MIIWDEEIKPLGVYRNMKGSILEANSEGLDSVVIKTGLVL